MATFIKRHKYLSSSYITLFNIKEMKNEKSIWQWGLTQLEIKIEIN